MSANVRRGLWVLSMIAAAGCIGQQTPEFQDDQRPDPIFDAPVTAPINPPWETFLFEHESVGDRSAWSYVDADGQYYNVSLEPRDVIDGFGVRKPGVWIRHTTTVDGDHSGVLYGFDRCGMPQWMTVLRAGSADFAHFDLFDFAPILDGVERSVFPFPMLLALLGDLNVTLSQPPSGVDPPFWTVRDLGRWHLRMAVDHEGQVYARWFGLGYITDDDLKRRSSAEAVSTGEWTYAPASLDSSSPDQPARPHYRLFTSRIEGEPFAACRPEPPASPWNDDNFTSFGRDGPVEEDSFEPSLQDILQGLRQGRFSEEAQEWFALHPSYYVDYSSWRLRDQPAESNAVDWFVEVRDEASDDYMVAECPPFGSEQNPNVCDVEFPTPTPASMKPTLGAPILKHRERAAIGFSFVGSVCGGFVTFHAVGFSPCDEGPVGFDFDPATGFSEWGPYTNANGLEKPM